MKNRSIAAFALVFLTLGIQHIFPAVALVEAPVANMPGLDDVYERPIFQAKPRLASSHDHAALLAQDFENIHAVGKGLFSAALLSDGLEGVRYEEFKLQDVLGGLDYVSSEELRFEIPNTQYVITATWGFGGSGKQNLELMLPLPEVAIKLVINEDAHVAAVRHKDGAFVEFGKIVIQNELRKLASASEGDLGKILKTFGIAPTLKPRAVFLIKLALLLQHFAKYQDMTFFTNELGFLVCRLVMSGDLVAAGMDTPSLTALLPKSVVDVLKQQFPSLLPLVEHMFSSTKKLFTSAHSDAALTGKKTLVYVFDGNKDLVKNFETYAPTVVGERNVEEMLTSFLGQANKQVIDWVDFSSLYKDSSTSPILMRSLVGSVVIYGDDLAELIEIGFLTKEEAASLQAGGAVRSFVKGPLVIVVCRPTNSFFDLPQTISAVSALVAKFWKQYMTLVHKEIAQGRSLDQNELLLDKPSERQELRRFLKSEEGLRLQVRLDNAIQAVRNPFDKAYLKREQKADELGALDRALETMQVSLGKNVANRARLEAMNLPEMATVIEHLDKQIADLEHEIAQQEAAMKLLKDELDLLGAQIDGNDELVKRDKLEKLLKILKKKYAAGHDVDGDLLVQVKQLQQELEKEAQDAAVVRAKTTLSSQDKIDLRDAVLAEYQCELAQVEKDLALLNAEQSITTGLIERISQLSLYKKFLVARVNRMQEQQKDLRLLVAFKEATERGVYLDDDQYAQFYDLECELKYILKSNNVVDICRLFKPVESLTTRFVNEMTQPAKDSVFMGMHQEFVKDLANIIARSGIAVENEVLVKYFLGMVFPVASQHIIDEIFAQVGAR